MPDLSLEHIWGAPEMMSAVLRDHDLHVTADPAVRAVNSISDSEKSSFDWANKIWGDSRCVNEQGIVQIFNRETKFFTSCFIAAVALGITLIFLVPVILRIVDLGKVQRGSRTLCGQISTMLAACAAMLSMYTGDLKSAPPPITIFVGSFGLVVAALSYVQDGRVAISAPELLLYWLGFIFVYSGFAIDAFLCSGYREAWSKILAAIFAIVVMISELWNPARKETNRFDDTSIFAKISTCYSEKLMKDPSLVTHDALLDPPSGLDALSSYDEFTTKLANYDKSSKYRVVLALKDVVGSVLMKIIVSAAVSSIVTLCIPQVMEKFLSSLTNYTSGTTPIYESYYLALLLGVVPLISSSFDAMQTVTANCAENKSRAALMTAMYRKSLRLSPAARERFESGKIMNMMSVDTQQVFMLAYNSPNIISLPITLFLSIWQLWRFLGPSFLAALVVYGLVIPASTKLSTMIGALNPDLMKFKDQRNKLTSNAFRCIKSLKLHAWESPFFKRISEYRRSNEIKLLLRRIRINLAMSVAWNTSGDLVAGVVFLTYLYLQVGSLSPPVVFPSLVLLQNASSAILIFPQSLNSILLALNAQRRINELLIETEQDHENYYRMATEAPASFKDTVIDLKNATISWNGDTIEEKIAVKNISFKTTKGDSICVVGRVGSGKTALMQAICGDLCVLSGEIVAKGTIAYCSQETWLQSYSIQDNITFGTEFDENWYRQVVDACELTADIDQMPSGHRTEVGERGISLSGGQKARVALARAVYSRADVIILDDVLSAVDEHVSSASIVKLSSTKGMLANRTILLATNNVRVLSHSSLIIALQKKQVVESISFKEVISKGRESSVYRLIEEYGHTGDLQQEAKYIVERKQVIEEREISNPTSFPPSVHEKAANICRVDFRRDGDRKEEEEGDSQKLKSLEVFKKYLLGDRPWIFIIWLAIMLISTVITNSAIVYMGYITNHNLKTLYEGRWYMTGYFAINLASAAFIVMSSYFLTTRIGSRNSKYYHDKMLWNVLHAPMSFFDATPLGRIINRFSGDLALLDENIPTVVYYTLRSFVNSLTVVAGILVGSPIVIIAIVPLAWISNRSRVMYVPTQRKVVRIASAANSPILSHIEDTLKGQSTIRAFSQSPQFASIFDQRVDYWVKAAFYSGNLTQWLGYRIQALTTALSSTTALAVTHLISTSYISTGYAAVIINFAQRAGVMVRQTIMLLAQAETSGVALERLMEYIDIKKEAASVIEATRPDNFWPATGKVEFCGLSSRYTDDGPDILKNLNFTINGGEKIGVVGRTGSGKSTLAATIFRIIEAHKGCVEIDGVDISVLGSFDLRSRLSIIPQDAQIFDGSLRENLDPLQTCDDVQLWNILDLCHLKDHFIQANGLDTELTDSGSNLSRGQAQLLCLGRALVHHSKVLISDEATASVDHETDKLVQETIRQNFSDRSIITIAHRLNTIMDSDRILVLDKGEVKEFDTPQKLSDAKGLSYSSHNTESKEDEEEMKS